MKGLRPGDVFVLNGRTLRLVETRLLTAKVAPADSSVPTVPRWYANKMPLASGLADEVARLRTEMARQLAGDGTVAGASAWLETEYALTSTNARALTEHFALQASVSVIPTRDFFLVEEVAQGDVRHFFFHALIGRSANDALSRIIAQRLHEARGGNALITIDDYGFLLTVRPFQAPAAEEWQGLFRREGAEDALRSALSESNLVKWQFRGVAQTGLMVPRRVQGAERGARALQWSSEIIFEVLRRHESDHPLLQEAYAEATQRFLDLPRALEFLDQVGRLPWDVRPLARISPFSFGMYVSRIRETMTLEDPETTIERLFHEMYGAPATNRPAGAPEAP
jgi:ATP-dependent Lhr-like helicase